jgi:hypothetical protein
LRIGFVGFCLGDQSSVLESLERAEFGQTKRNLYQLQ